MAARVLYRRYVNLYVKIYIATKFIINQLLNASDSHQSKD